MRMRGQAGEEASLRRRGGGTGIYPATSGGDTLLPYDLSPLRSTCGLLLSLTEERHTVKCRHTAAVSCMSGNRILVPTYMYHVPDNVVGTSTVVQTICKVNHRAHGSCVEVACMYCCM